MNRQSFLRLMICLVFFLSLQACKFLQPSPTPNIITTGVARTKTVWVTHTAIAETLIAGLPLATRTPILVTLTATSPTSVPVRSSSKPSSVVVIKFIDTSELKLYNWSFLYRWANQDQAPPEGYKWNADYEKTSMFLFLRRLSDGAKYKIGSNELTRLEWDWWETESNLHSDLKTLTIVKTNGEKIELPEDPFVNEYYVDLTELTPLKWAREGTAYIFWVIRKWKKVHLIPSCFHSFIPIRLCMAKTISRFRWKLYLLASKMNP